MSKRGSAGRSRGWSPEARAKRKATLEAKKALTAVWPKTATRELALGSIGADDADLLTAEQLLQALVVKGGTFKAVAEAQLLVLKKSQDYNQQGGADKDPGRADRDAYFPFGPFSYAQMIHVKAQRLNSLSVKTVRAVQNGGAPEFEGIRDTLLDIINYASFWIERMDREGGK